MGRAAIPDVHFADCRGARVAWQEWGSGPDVVAIPPAAQNIEAAWEWHGLRTMFDRFGEFCHYVHFDKRGTGSSDRTVRVPHVDDRVDDLKAVMDAADIEHAHLFVQSEGGVTALLFAAAYPQRVDSLIMLGSAACLVPPGVELTDELRAEQFERREAFARAWGTPQSWAPELFAPSLADDPEFRSWWERYERQSASYESVRDLFVQMLDMDATDVIDDIEAPMLVMSRSGDQAMPIELARDLAARARSSTLIELDGRDHFAFVGDIEAWMQPMEKWVTGSVAPRPDARQVPSSAHVTTLGRFAVHVDGREVDVAAWGSRKARTLLKRLVVARGWPVTRDELFDLLWPDEVDRTKLGSRLSVQLSHVRRVLGGGVVADLETIALDRNHVTTDLDAVLSAGDDATIVATIVGEFLPEDRYDDWAMPVREQVRATLVGAIRRRLADLDTDAPERAELERRLREAGEWVDLTGVD